MIYFWGFASRYLTEIDVRLVLRYAGHMDFTSVSAHSSTLLKESLLATAPTSLSTSGTDTAAPPSRWSRSTKTTEPGTTWKRLRIWCVNANKAWPLVRKSPVTSRRCQESRSLHSSRMPSSSHMRSKEVCSSSDALTFRERMVEPLTSLMRSRLKRS